MKYSISEMAALLGVTTHMLRHYEKMGIITPDVDPANGYRMYTVIDTRRFNLSRNLLAAGIPLEQCAEMMKDLPMQEVDAVFARKEKELERQIVRVSIARKYLQTQRRIWETLSERVGTIWVDQYPRMWRLNFSQVEKPFLSRQLQEEKEEWLKCLPAVFWVSRIPNAVLSSFSEGEIEYGYGLMCYEEDALALGLRQTANVEIVPGGDYLITMHRKTVRGPFTWEDIRAMTDYIRARGISFFGDAFSMIAASREEDGVQANYHTLFLKIFS